MELGKTLGVIFNIEVMRGGPAAQFARQVEKLGYSALWYGEGVSGRDPFVIGGHLMANTDNLIIGTAIVNVWKRSAVAMVGAAKGLAEIHGPRFILGLGVSHQAYMERYGFGYEKPLTYMRAYLNRMKETRYFAPRPIEEPPILLGAVRPKMLELAAAAADGVMPANCGPELTARARAVVGPDKWVCSSVIVIFERDPAIARAAGRDFIKFYLRLENYRRNWRLFGFTDADFADGGSDRLVDTLVAWGDEPRIRERIDQYYAAGANHVFIYPARTDASIFLPEQRTLDALAPAR
jgi:probable F420-dependent oxidoreductase